MALITFLNWARKKTEADLTTLRLSHATKLKKSPLKIAVFISSPSRWAEAVLKLITM